MKHKAKLTITRPICGDGRKVISIQVEDADAGIRFLELEVPLDNFSECLTGLSFVECDMKFRGLQNVGKKKERMPVTFQMPDHADYSNRKEVAKEIAQDQVPAGWLVSDYFDSQNSFFMKDGKEFARTNAVKWVEKETTEEDS